ncbi:hypothetical protein [Endozoicomonas sp. Mp262]|uniref:hypothetical protein n=1 Tax=Endozoicomonas sp. Mp262 TaxID=2919499 RepID=UPI0021DFE47B
MLLRKIIVFLAFLLSINGYASYNTETWMEDLYGKDSTVKLSEIVIPGSHDSGAFDVSPHKDKAAKFKGKPYPIDFIQNWSETQSKTIRQQLDSGIRFLDFRLESVGNQIHFSHGVIFDEISTLFQDVFDFTNKNTEEVVIVRIQETDSAPSNTMTKFFDKFCNDANFKSHFVPETRKSDLSFSNLLNSGKRIILVSGESPPSSCGGIVWDTDGWYPMNESYSESDYQDPKKIKPFLTNLHKNAKDRGEKLFIEQHIVTPNDETIKNGVLEDVASALVCGFTFGIYCNSITGDPTTLREYNEQSVRKQSVGWINEQYYNNYKSNIVIFDYVDASQTRMYLDFNVNNGDVRVPGKAEKDDSFGRTLASGDFNGDGVDDLIVGYSTEDINGHDDAGSLSIIYGSNGVTVPAKGLHRLGAKGFHQDVIVGNITAENGDQFASAFAVGDFNNDGYSDLAVGAAKEDVNGKDDAGAVVILYGGLEGLKSNNVDIFNQDALKSGQNEKDDHFGYSLASADFNNDGFDDLAIGAPKEDLSGKDNAGIVWVMNGHPNGLYSNRGTNKYFHQNTSGLNGISLEKQDQFGFRLAAGDINGSYSRDIN